MENKREKIEKIEFFCLVNALTDNGKLRYNVELIGDKVTNLFSSGLEIINSELVDLNGDKYKIEINQVVSLVRRYAEINFAKSVAENCSHEDAIVVDGSIKAENRVELELLKGLCAVAKEKKINLGFLSKTCRLLTKNASSLNSVLNEIGPKSSWYYYPVFESNCPDFLGEIHFVKLNSNSNYVFKLELDKNCSCADFILALSMNSNDPVFYGYPFALIEADKNARVTNREKEYLQTVLISKIKNKDRLKYILSNLDSHNILDKISY